MKRMITAVFSIAGLATVAMLAPTAKHYLTVLPVVHAQSGCSNATLSGSYGFTFSGFQLQTFRSPTTRGKPPLFPVPFYGAGLAHADGLGVLTADFASSLNSDPYETGTSTYAATYTVNPDCTGLLTSTNGADNFTFVIVGGGSEILGTDISDPDTVNIDFKKQ